MPPSDLPPWKRTLRALRRGPADFLLERASWPGMVVDVAIVATLGALGLPFGTVLAIDWAAGEIPGVINFGRALAHRDPKAKPGEWWKRDWTYWTRPNARQAPEVSETTRDPIESSDSAKGIPRWLRWVSARARERGKPSLIAYFDDWLNERSRVLGFAVEKSFLLAGLFVGIPWLALFLTNDIVVTRIPNAISWYVALRNHDLRRVTRPGIWQRPGDVVVERSSHTLDLRGVRGVGRPERERQGRGPLELSGPARRPMGLDLS